MDSSRFRPLMAGPPPQASTNREPFRKKKRISIACNDCRVKKTACDGVRPVCTACQIRASECIYRSAEEHETPTMVLKRENDALRENLSTFTEFISELRSAPEDTVQNIIRKLRSTSNPLAVVKAAKGDLKIRQLSEQTTALAMLPPIHSEAEYRLMVRHPNAYHTMDIFKDVRWPPNACLGMLNLRDGLLPSEKASTAMASAADFRDDNSNLLPLSDSRGSKDNESIVRYFDSRLARVRIGFWTSVPVSDQFAACAISLYLQTDHPVFGPFDASLFVRDLVEFKLDFCSPFLVSSLMALACQGYTYRDPGARAFSYEFEKEACNLWEAERTSDSVTTLAALTLLSLSLASHAQDEDRKPILNAVHGMAKRMKLFGVPDALSDMPSVSADMLRATAHTAWGAFNSIQLHALFYTINPTPYPPALPVPDTPVVCNDHVEDNHDHSSCAIGIHDTFASTCRLYEIMTGVLLTYRNGNLNRGPSLAFALSRFSMLLHLADTVPSYACRRLNTPPHALAFHIFYHIAVLETVRPLIALERQRGSKAYSERVTSPVAIFSASIKQLQGLIHDYTSISDAAKCSILWGYALVPLGGAALKSGDWNYFLYCIEVYQQLRPSYMYAEIAVRGLLALALNEKAITKDKARMLMEGPNEQTIAAMKKPMRGGFAIDLEMAATDPTNAGVDVLSEQMDDIRLFDEFTVDVL